MSPATLRFATWNIGGAILGRSHQRGARSSVDYYAAILREHEPDVVCLQEAHSFPDGEGQAEYLARECGYQHVAAFPVSKSHLAKGAFLALGILSRFPIRTPVYRKFPNPGLTSVGPDGTQWKLLDKGYVKATVDLGDYRLGVLNAHCFPLHYFRARPTESRFSELWRMLGRDLVDLSDAMPAIAGIDLNYAPIHDLLTGLLRSGGYSSAFNDRPTTSKGIQQDYIIYDQRMQLLKTTVRPTESDHSYCQVEVVVRPPERAKRPAWAVQDATVGGRRGR